MYLMKVTFVLYTFFKTHVKFLSNFILKINFKLTFFVLFWPLAFLPAYLYLEIC